MYEKSQSAERIINALFDKVNTPYGTSTAKKTTTEKRKDIKKKPIQKGFFPSALAIHLTSPYLFQNMEQGIKKAGIPNTK